MQSALTGDFYRAIYFMDAGQVQRAMRFTEFEAFLDGYVGLSDLADTDVRAVYAELSETLGVRALVFFSFYFDDEGRGDSSWNLPLDQLASAGSLGPDLGEGPVRLVCRSRCPDPAIADALWDPEMSPGSNDFQGIRKAVQANSLKFIVRAPAAEPDIPVLTAQAPDTSGAETELAEQRIRLARLIRQQRLRIKTLEGAHRDAIRELHREHRLEMQGFHREQVDTEQQIERLKLANTQLKQKLTERNEQYLDLQQQMTAAPSEAASEQQQMELVLLREQLERKEREAAQRQEQIAQLEEQVELLEAAVPDEDSLMQRLQEQSVFLVAYHPGVGHMTLPYDDIERYFKNPLAYAAAKCDLAQPDYERWLAHYEQPVCQADADGEACQAPLLRVSDPREFQSGRDDRCERHQLSS